ncbi:MAG: alpha/beta hydrolase [Pseudomonadota bacterium]
MTTSIERKIILVEGRHVHMRICGDGPPALLLHQSPRTSEELEGLMQAWGAYFTCIVPDHPGYGLSDPLPIDAPTIDDFGDATAALIEALGLSSVPIYGHHTGAKIGLALAVHHPEKVASIVLNGLLINTQADRDDFANNYLPPFEPSHDARHLMQLWWRMREQTLFFPWYNRKEAARMVFGIRPAADVHVACMDFLAAEDNYRRGYGAALAMVGKDYVDQLAVKTLITAVKSDPLWVDIGRLESRGDTHVERFDTMEPLLDAALTKLQGGQGDTSWDRAALQQTGKRRIEGGLTTFHSQPGQQPTLLAMPDAGSEWLCDQLVLDALPGPALAINPPGHGLSGADGDWPETTGIQTILSMGLGFAHLPPLLGRHPGARLILVDPLLPAKDAAAYTGAYVPDLTPTPSGGHLATAFLAARSALVFWPWQTTEPQCGIPGEHLLDAYDLHVKTRALLRGWQAGQSAAAQADALLSTVLAHPGKVIVALPDWAKDRQDVQKTYGDAKIVYYDFQDRTNALAALAA